MDAQDGVGLVFVLFVSTILRKTVFATAIEKFNTTDTESWSLAVVIAWEVLPIFLIAMFLILPILAVRR